MTQKHELTAENLTHKVNDAGEVIREPGYLGYLREHGYPIDGVKEPRTIKRRDSDTAHDVMKVETLEKPTSHPESDVVADKLVLPVCDCWEFRTNSAAVGDGETLAECGTCPHIRAAYKVENAKADDQQETFNP